MIKGMDLTWDSQTHKQGWQTHIQVIPMQWVSKSATGIQEGVGGYILKDNNFVFLLEGCSLRVGKVTHLLISISLSSTWHLGGRHGRGR